MSSAPATIPLPVFSRRAASFDPETASAEEVIAWVQRRFRRQRLVATSSFGMEGCVLLDMLGRSGLGLDVVTIDTGFLFPETLALRDRMVERHPALRFRIIRPALTPTAQAQLHGPVLWTQQPTDCCRLRKVEPLREALADADIWLTALRRGQSETRRRLAVVAWDARYELVKINPLARWSRRDVWEYVRRHDVPVNPLHERGYPSIGCTHCTRPVAGSTPDTYSRAGRWAHTTKTECGLHFGEGI